jgi:hypothetical protein
MRLYLPLAAAALLASLAPAGAVAQDDMSDADVRELLAYRLTMPKLRQLNAAYTDLYRQMAADPKYQQLLKKKQELAKLAEKEDPTEAEMERMARLEEEIAALEQADEDESGEEIQSLDALAARLTADPRIAGALERAGLAAREAAVMQFALFQAGFAAEMLESGTIKELPKQVSAENVRFYQAHKAEIEGLRALARKDDQ